MDLKQMDISKGCRELVYYDSNGLLRKYISSYHGESEHIFFVSYYNKKGSAVYIAYQAGNNMEDEKGFVYLDKGNIVLQNSVTYPYYEEYYIDGKLYTEGEKGSYIAKTDGKFLYETPLFKMGLNIYASIDSLKKYHDEDGQSIELTDKATAVNFSNTGYAYVTSCNEGTRALPDLSSPIVDSIIYAGAPIKIIEKCKGETIGDWGFNHWYKVEFGDVGYIYGAFLEPIENPYRKADDE